MTAPRERLPTSQDEAPKRAKRRRNPVLALLRGIMGVALAVGVVSIVAAALFGFSLYRRYAADLPTLDGLRTYQPPLMTRVYAGNDRLMAELATERRIFIPETAIPKPLEQAFISAEDQSFYTHKGIDPFAIARAAVTDLERMGDRRRPVGASTITQQVARNMLLGSNTVSFERKVKEALLALRIEHTLSKQRILELYLNEIYLGQGAYGVVAAAETYFDKPLDKLTLAEDAMLAALPKSPSNYNPLRSPDAARARRDWVLDRMADTHAITQAQADAAKQATLVPAASQRHDLLGGADWFTDDVRRRLIDRFGTEQATRGGLTVLTSLDPALQTQAEQSLHAGLLSYDRSHGGWRGPAGHVPTAPGWRGEWPALLARQTRPPGMLPDWQLAVVLETAPSTARIGWIDPNAPVTAADPAGNGYLAFADTRWARPERSPGVFGPSPSRMGDVVRPGDLVMIAVPPGGTTAGPHGARMRLVQIPAVEGGIVSLDPVSGRVLAMVGGWSHEQSVFNRATQAQRQPGSSFKPFVYLAAMEQGISPSDEYLDAPFVLGDWRPNNYELTFNGPTSLHTALAESLNLVTVRLAQKIGMDNVAKTAIALHEVEAMPHYLPASLGAVDTTILREAGAYAAIDEGGREVVPSLIDSVQDHDGHVIWRAPGLSIAPGDPASLPLVVDARSRVADAASAFQVLMMMQGVVKTGTGVPVVAGLDRPIAGKTGTSQDFNDAWFAGFTPDLVTVVWVGFDQPATLGEKETGAAVAGPIWHDFMKTALADRPKLDFRVPDGVALYRWNSAGRDAVDAFKPEQKPGASGDEAGPQDASAVQMLDGEAGDTSAADAAASPPSALPGSASPGSSSQGAGAAGSGTSVDSGVGAVY